MFFVITVYVIQVSKYQTVLLHLSVHLGVRHPVGTSIDLMALLQSHAPSHTELISTQVAVCKAIVSENCTLVNCGDYVELCLPHELVGGK